MVTSSLGKTNRHHRQARRHAVEVCSCSPRRRAPLAGTPHSQSRSPQSRHSSSRFRYRSTVFRRSAAGSHKIHGPSRRHTLVHRANSIASRLFLVLHRSRKSRSSQCQPHSRRSSPPAPRQLPSLVVVPTVQRFQSFAIRPCQACSVQTNGLRIPESKSALSA